MVQSIEEERLRRIVDDTVDDSSDSEMDISINSNSYNDSYVCASANESTDKCHVFVLAAICVNSCSKLFYFHNIRLRFRVIQ
jgi:hypothetical protein